jgi:hypothetical protein
MQPPVKVMRIVEIVVAAIGVFVAGFAYAQSRPSIAQGDQPNRVSILYVAPKNSEFQEIYDLVQARLALEKIQRILKPLRLPAYAWHSVQIRCSSTI